MQTIYTSKSWPLGGSLAVWLSVFSGAVLCAGCVGLPAKLPPVQLEQGAHLEGVQTAVGGAWPDLAWWQHYADPTLDRLIELGGATSPSLATALARYDSARQSVRLAAAASGAHLEASGDFNRQRLSDNGFISPRLLGFTWYNQADLGLQASYTFDWWDKQRDAVEAAIDQAQAAQAERSAAALMLASSIADTYFAWQADENRLALAREKETAALAAAHVAAARVQADLDAGDTLDRSGLALAAAREQIAALEGSASLRVVALAALVGRSVAELPTLSVHPLPVTAATLPDDVRIDLIARRADITASRWRVEAAEKSLSGARAEFFPDVSVNLLAGLTSVDIGRLFEYSSRVPMAGAALHLPIFDAGRLKARYGGARATLDAAVAAYQDTVINAARDVATQASTGAQIAAQRRQRDAEVEAAAHIRTSAAARVTQGLTDERAELTATESWIEQRDARLQLDAAAVSADIALQRALGGGFTSAAIP